jgi:very-short-patch-repair endonuclease/predicted transcriptional regulator of viral defense system
MTSISRADSRIWAIVRRQHGVVTGAQLRAAGLTHSAIKHRVRTGRLWRVHRDVFAVGRAELTREGRLLAAVHACGDGAALSHLSAAALWAIREPPPRCPQVSVPMRGGRRGPRGIELHCAATLQPNDVTERSAIPVTTLHRTLIDLAAILDDRQLKSALRQSERVHKLDLAKLRVSVDDRPSTSPAPARLRHLLDDYIPARTESELEAAFLELCARHGLRIPETQVAIGPYRADFLWRDRGLVVETDGRDTHDGFVAFRDDRARDRAMKAAGFEVLRFTGSEVLREPRKVARELSAALRRSS